MCKLFKSSFGLFFLLLFIVGCREELPSQDDTDGNGYITHSTREFLYVGNNSRREIYKIELESNSIVDTLKGMEAGIIGAITSIDGRKMYVPTYVGNPDVVYVFNLETGALAVASHTTSHLYTSPEGDVIILTFINNNTRTKVGLIDTQTDLITYLDTLELKYDVYPSQQCVIDGNGKYLYAETIDGKLLKYYYGENRVERIYEGDFSLKCLALSSDGKTLYNTGGSVIDIESGRIIGSMPVSEYGHLAVSPDGRYVYLTDPTGKNGEAAFPTAKIFVYDTRSFTVTGEISVHGHVNYLSYTDDIAITGDGTKAYVSGFRDVFVIDLINKRTSGVIGFATGFMPIGLFIGTWIE